MAEASKPKLSKIERLKQQLEEAQRIENEKAKGRLDTLKVALDQAEKAQARAAARVTALTAEIERVKGTLVTEEDELERHSEPELEDAAV